MATNPQIRIIDLPLDTSIISTYTNEYVAIESVAEGGRKVSVTTLLSGGESLFVPLPGTGSGTAGIAGISTDKAVVRFNGTRGLIQNSTATLDDTGVFTAVGFISTSSERYKENITPITNALAAVKKLEGVLYNRKATDRREMGLIAERVYSVVPEVVSLDNNGQPEGIEYSRLVALLINAVNELNQKVDALNINR